MSRSASAGMISHLASSTHTRCRMLRLDLVDGTVIAVTDHDGPLDFDLGDGVATYSPATGILPSDVSLSAGFTSDDLEVSGPIGDVVTLAGVLGGRFDDARARFFQINWNSLVSGPLRILGGLVVKAEVEAGAFRFTLNSEISKFAQMVGRVMAGTCDADFGDARCAFAVPVLAAEVTAVTDPFRFTVSFMGSYPDDHFNIGTATFTGGALAGTRPIEILDWTAAGVVTLWQPLLVMPEIGDTLDLRPGCSKLRKSDDSSVPTCMSYDNILNFRGFPEVPGSDQALRYPGPGGT